MDHYIATGINAPLYGVYPVLSVRIGNMNRFVKLAVRILVIQHVMAFGCALIAALLLVSGRLATESNGKRSKLCTVLHEIQTLLALDHKYSVRYLFRFTSGCLQDQQQDGKQGFFESDHARNLSACFFFDPFFRDHNHRRSLGSPFEQCHGVIVS